MPQQVDDVPEIRFGLIGCGDIGALRAAALATTPGCRFVAASDIDAQKAKLLTTRYGAQTDRDWTTLLARQDLDAVILSTPPSLHAEMCIAALEAGKHVLCEKPLARTPDECRAMISAAERTDRKLATGFNYRFYPSFQRARELLDSGRIGALDHIRSYGGYSATSHNQPWVHDGATVGGGALRDIGIHLIDLTRDFLGEVAEVKGFASDGVWNFPGCEDNGFMLMRSTEGRVASLQASWTEWRRYQFRIELYGTKGCIRATCFPMMTQVVWADETGGATQKKTEWFPGTAVAEKLRSYRWVVVRSFVEEFTAFRAWIRGEKTRIASGHDGLRAIEIADAATVSPLPSGSAARRPDTREAYGA